MALTFKTLLQTLAFSCIALTVTLSSLAVSKTKPQNIVSLSLCTDQLLLLLSDKNNIASVSYLAANPEYSFIAHEATGLFLNKGQVEEILPLQPDLILSSQFSATAAVNLLKRLGHEVTVLDFPATVQGSYTQIRQVAALLMEEERGEVLIAQMQSNINLSMAQIPKHINNKAAVFYSSNGFSYGSATLRNDFLERLGLNNLAANSGMVGPGQISLETIISAEPDYLLVDKENDHTNKLAHPMLQHPALNQMFSQDKIITVPDTLFQCAGPSLAEAFSIMAEALNQDVNESGNNDE